ncbi:TMEM175 family protein, partial [Mesorhizobium sp. M8A.F.Ca.ET.021.01.1.1]
MKRPLEASVEGRGRIVGITDGVFAIALTLIVLEIRVPVHQAIHSEHDLLVAIAALAPRFLTYALSFLTLTIFWFGQQAQHGLIAKSDRRLATLNLCFLAFIAL